MLKPLMKKVEEGKIKQFCRDENHKNKMEILAIKNTVTKMKNALNRLVNRLDKGKERINKPKGKSNEITQT